MRPNRIFNWIVVKRVQFVLISHINALLPTRMRIFFNRLYSNNLNSRHYFPIYTRVPYEGIDAADDDDAMNKFIFNRSFFVTLLLLLFFFFLILCSICFDLVSNVNIRATPQTGIYYSYWNCL